MGAAALELSHPTIFGIDFSTVQVKMQDITINENLAANFCGILDQNGFKGEIVWFRIKRADLQ